MPGSASTDHQDDADPAGLRALRPAAPSKLERRISVAAILNARDQAPKKVCVGRLEVEKRLGEGAMGVVYRAFDPELARTVAVKVLRAHASDFDERRIRAEAMALARLSHPGVVAVYDISSAEGEVFLSMEYVDGGTLRAWLDAHPEAPLSRVLGLFLQAARGLAAAHAAGVVHQDFKPENVLVTRDGQVKVADFGLAQIDSSGAGRRSPTSRFAGGTPHYMAPEIGLGAPATALADQYSFCVALNDLLAPGRDVRSVDRLISPRLGSIAERGLSGDPGARWPSMDALGDALEELITPRADQRHRALLLERVESLWLDGVLGPALHGQSLIPLTLRDSSDQLLHRGAGMGAPATSILELEALLERSQRALLILGAPGAGKTTTLLTLTQALLRRARSDRAEPVPVVLSLAGFDVPGARGGAAADPHAFRAWLTEAIKTKYNLPSRWIQSWLENNELVLLLDALDEVPAAQRPGCVEALHRFLAEYSCGVVLTCRDDACAELEHKLDLRAAVKILPLSDDQVEVYLGEDQARRFADAASEAPDLREHMRSPLMLRLLVLAGLDGDGSELRFDVHERFVQFLLARAPDSSRTAILSRVTWLARAMQREGTTDLWLERLTARFLERPWEQRCAKALGVIAVALASAGISLGVQLIAGLHLNSSLPMAVLTSAIVLALLRTATPRPVEQPTWSWRRALRWTPGMLTLAALAGVGMSARYWLSGEQTAEGVLSSGLLFRNLTVSLLLGVAGGLSMGLEPGDQVMRPIPNAGMRYSLVNALRVSIPAALLVGVAVAYVAVPYLLKPWTSDAVWSAGTDSLAVRCASTFGVVMFFAHGGGAVFLHGAIRVMLALRTPLPLNLVSFLDHAASLGILRRVGGGYLFIHRTLLEYFAALKPGSHQAPTSDP